MVSIPSTKKYHQKYHQIVGTSMNLAGNRWKQYIRKNRYDLIVYGRFWTFSDQEMAEEVGVEPTRRLNSGSTALKAARPTGDDALPSCIVSDRKAQSRATYSKHHFYLLYN